MSARFIAPKVASLVGSTSAKVARPVVRSSIKATASQRVSSTARNNAFQTLKRQQITSKIISSTLNTKAARPFSSEIATAMVQVSQNLGMGSAAIGLGGAGIGIGMVFAALLTAVARNPSMRGQLFSYAILGFAFVEAIGLFDLMVAMMCKYV
ncbi:ATP synthase protein 9 [Acephala macrosclerotiorum]|nr:ATP synthase protein 9 [Acephala macrosclerotiorum]